MADNDQQSPPAAPDIAPVSAAAAEPVGTISTETILAAQPARAVTAPGPEAQAAEPLASGRKGQAIVRTAWPVDSFDSGVEGVDTITSAGVEVGPSKVDELLAAAASAGTTLEVVS